MVQIITGAGPLGGILIHSADPALTDIILLFRNIFSVDQDLAAVHRNASADDVQHGSLTGTITSYDRYKFSVLYRKIEILEQTQLVDRAGIVIFIDIDKL